MVDYKENIAPSHVCQSSPEPDSPQGVSHQPNHQRGLGNLSGMGSMGYIGGKVTKSGRYERGQGHHQHDLHCKGRDSQGQGKPRQS